MFSFNFDRFLPDVFQATYKCFSVSMLPDERQNLEKGGKIIMPPSALHTLTRLNTDYPMLFKLTNRDNNRHTHSGVLEFIAEEGKVYLPYWMMRNLLLDEGSILHVQSTSLQVATYSKFQPQSVDFLDIHNPKAVLENALRNFACLTTGDVIAINYNNKIYELSVLQTKPGEAVSIIECDMNVEFEAPVGYQEPTRKSQQTTNNDTNAINEDVDLIEDVKTNQPFTGKGNRIDGKAPKETTVTISKEKAREMPDYNYAIGTIKFWRINKKTTNELDQDNEFEPFNGEGQTLFKKKTS